MSDKPTEISLYQWETLKPVAMQVPQEAIDEIHELMTVVGEKIEALGTTFNFSFVTKMNKDGTCQIHSRMGATPQTMSAEFWASMFLITGGLDNLLDNLPSLADAANTRHEMLNAPKLILVPTPR